MPPIDSNTAYLFFGAALLGLSLGVFSNFFITSFFRIVDDLFVDDVIEIRVQKDIQIKRQQVNLFLFFISVIGLLYLTFYILNLFEKFRPVI